MNKRQARRSIDDVLPLSPLQEGLLFHALSDTEHSGAYIAQLMWHLEGVLDVDALKHAAQTLLSRHSNLRVSFKYKDLSQPVQVVAREVSFPWKQIDLSTFDEPQRNRHLEEFLERDRAIGFQVGVPPLLRFTLINMQDNQNRLVFTFHHILLDGWSTRLLARKLFELYERRGSEVGRARVAPYRTYLEWLQRQDRETARGAWKEELAGVEQGTFVAPRKITTGRRARKHFIFELPRELAEALTKVCRAYDVTLNALIGAVWAIVLGRLTGQQDLVFGLTVAGRPAEIQDIETMVGLFINTIPVRTRLEPSDRIIALLTRLLDRQSKMMEYHYLSLAEIQEQAGVGTLFDTQVVFETFPKERHAAGDEVSALKVRIVGGHDDSHYPLSLIVTSGASLRVCLSYNEDLLRADYIEAIGYRLQRLFEIIGQNPELQIGRLDVLDPAEKALLFKTWNATERPIQKTILTRMFSEQVQKTPDATAVEYEDRMVSYEELDRRANQLAHYLRGIGVGPETRVAVCAERSIEMVVALLGALKAGGTYVPVDAEYPSERIAHILEHAQAPVVLTAERFEGGLPVSFASVVRLDADWPTIEKERREAPDIDADPENLAYVIYTSGSTGIPKGIAVSHSALVNHMLWIQDLLALKADDKVLQKTSFTFDASVWEFYAPLFSGARLVMAHPGAHRSPEAIFDLLRRCRISVLQVVPSFLSVLLDAATLLECGALRHVFCGGEPLSSDLRDRFFASSQATLHNLYGPAEATIDSTWATCDRSISDPQVPIGSPVWNTRAYVLDESLQPALVGVAGELYIAGAGLARGYLGNAELTAERFLADPYGPPGTRMHRTGDRAQWRADGNLEFVGRRDEQVKIRGFRIELAEVESALRRQPEIRDAIATVFEDDSGEKRLVAHVTPSAKMAPDAAALRRRIANMLPAYMVPNAIVVSESFPLSPNGKVDRKALPKPQWTSEQTYLQPRTPQEELLCALFGEVLGLERVGVNDNFFDLGGHSLLATRLISRMCTRLGRNVEIGTLFEKPTVAQLAAWLMQEAAGSDDKIPALEPVPRAEEMPLSFAQERLWFAQQLNPHSIAYHVPVAMRVRGELELRAFQQSVNKLISRHEPLRTTFRLGPDGPVQVIGAMADLPMGIEQLQEGGTIEGWLAATAAAPFDLARGPLLRVRVLQLGPRDHVILLVLHHVVTDGWSLGVLFQELSALYKSHRDGRKASLPRLAVQYVDYAVWQRKSLDEERLRGHIEHWKRHLSGAPTRLELPTDRPRPPIATYRGARERVTLGPELAAALRALSQREGVTLFMTLLAGFQILLSRYAGQKDVVVGTSIAGRTQAATEPMIGLFFNMLPLRARLSSDMTFRELLRNVRQTTLDAYAHQELPFERLVAEMGSSRDLSYSPIFQVLFELQNTPQAPTEMAELEVKMLEVKTESAKFDLNAALVESGDKLLGVVEYNTDLFDASSIRRLITHYETLLSGIVAAPEQRIGTLPLLSPGERAQINEWNKTAVQFHAMCMDELFENQVDRAPTRVAVAYGKATLTYIELERRANQLAYYLRQRGVGPEIPVGLCMERNPDLVVALLGILKAGGLYVALDPAHPPERLAYMLEDSGARLLLTQAAVFSRLPATSVPVACIDSEWEAIAEAPTERHPRMTTAINLAYIYYTSGSTGRPKGVAMAHAGISNYFQWGIEAYRAAGGTGAAVHSSIAVDLTLTNFLPLFVGGRVDLAQEGPGVEGLVNLIQGQPQWSLLKLTPTHLALLNAHLSPAEMANSTRVLVIGADNLLAEPTSVWRRQAPNVMLINEYGPTETVVGCSAYVIPKTAPSTGPIPIGKPIANMTMYVLDEAGEPVPVGVPGELHIGGIGVARGYWNQPALTATRFLPDPFSLEPGSRLYRTGDRAVYSPDGNLKFIGRLDYQVKIRGYRVEPEEIEAILRSYPGVRQAAVIVREEHSDEKYLVAYIGAPQGGVDGAAVDAHLKERLPKHMVPSAVVVLHELPIGSTGKIDRRALPDPRPETPAPADVTLADPIEQKLLTVWRTVFNGRPCGLSNDFFEMGGDSIMLLRLMRRINDVFGTELPVSTLFQNRTVQAVARILRQQSGLQQEPAILAPLQPQGHRPPLFCVHPAGGEVSCYTALVRHMGAEQPIYGLQDPQSGSGGLSDLSIEGFAAMYVDVIRQVQPTGPYHIAGWSFGGVVAFEIAQQLHRAGQTVALLALIDTPHPDLNRGLDTESEQVYIENLARWAHEKAWLIGKDIALTAGDLAEMTRRDQHIYVENTLKAIGALPATYDPENIGRSLANLFGRARSVKKYYPDIYPGPITLFRAIETIHENIQNWPEESLRIFHERTRGWSKVSTIPVVVYDIPGNHTTMSIEPNVQFLAQKIVESLNDARAK